jgi:hypothetical protein
MFARCESPGEREEEDKALIQNPGGNEELNAKVGDGVNG